MALVGDLDFLLLRVRCSLSKFRFFLFDIYKFRPDVFSEKFFAENKTTVERSIVKFRKHSFANGSLPLARFARGCCLQVTLKEVIPTAEKISRNHYLLVLLPFPLPSN